MSVGEWLVSKCLWFKMLQQFLAKYSETLYALSQHHAQWFGDTLLWQDTQVADLCILRYTLVAGLFDHLY